MTTLLNVVLYGASGILCLIILNFIFKKLRERAKRSLSHRTGKNQKKLSREEQLLAASREGNLAIAEKLLESSPFKKRLDLERKDGQGNTALILSLKAGNEQMADCLVSHGADIEAWDGDGNTALILSILGKMPRTAELLLSKGASIDASVRNERTPLMAAIEDKQQDLIDLLLRKGADIRGIDQSGNTIFGYAIESANHELVRLLLEKGLDVNEPIKERSPLGLAVFVETFSSDGNSSHRIVETLVQNGANVDKAFRAHPGTPLMVTNNPDTAELLLAHGADVFLRDNHGNTALDYTHSPGVADLLIKKGLDINSKDNDGNTPLIRALSQENEALSVYLIENGADVNVGGKTGLTPLQIVRQVKIKQEYYVDENNRMEYFDVTVHSKVAHLVGMLQNAGAKE